MEQYFTDKNGNSYDITFGNGSNVIMCGYFAGTVTNIHEMIYANLGFGNTISRVRNIDTNDEYFIGQKVGFKHKSVDMDMNVFENGTIKEFFVNSFNHQIGARFTEKVGKHDLGELDIIDLNESETTIQDDETLRLTGVYFKKKFDVPLPINNNLGFDEISIFPDGAGSCIHIEVDKTKNIENIKVLDSNDIIWCGTMPDLIDRLK